MNDNQQEQQFDSGFSHNTSNVSNLSTALKSVYIHNNNTTTDQSYIDFGNIDQQQLQEQQSQQNNNNNNNNNSNNNSGNINTYLNRIPQQQVSRSPQAQSLFRNNGSPTTTYIQQRAGSVGNNNGSSFSQSGSYTPQQPSRLQQQYNQQQLVQEMKKNEEKEAAARLQQQQQEQHQLTNSILQVAPEIDNSRLLKFFDHQPTQGYTLFSHRSAPNGFKVAIVLSELSMTYRTFFLDFNKGEHRCPEFVSINPNARVPAMIDHDLGHLAIWESGAIILHLVNKFYKQYNQPLLWSDNLTEQSQISSWIFFQASGHAPMIGQALHFKYFHTTKIQSAIDRYIEEVRRVYGVVEMALAEKRESLIMDLDPENAQAYSLGTTPLSSSRFFDYPVWLVGDKITVADLSFVPWNNVVDRIGINIKVEFPEVYKWTKHMMRRQAVIKALRGE
ncbi:glutathione S-transferase [Hanseniaspora valbyensis NRRL Y-1626]|uniref:Glutathione S-transferase n=1 Tax=Hanseniaspora valbyensis NRRL Y-1626 TaxID=766949 RepID=A0A1B7TBH0_9ASCO|nr:glutathione S-transferase [Hanseniaspora valbyensis NRRL Y-1626]